MSACRPTNRIFAALLLSACSVPPLASEAKAGCFDWLCGRKTAYSAYYPVYPTYSYQTVGPPVSVAPVGGPVPAPAPVTGGIPAPIPTAAIPGVAPAPAMAPPTLTAPQAPLPVGPAPVSPTNSGVVQAQRPAYAPVYGTVQTYENPSVYTGLPVSNTPALPPQAYSSQRLPLTTAVAPATATVATPRVEPMYGMNSYGANRVPISTTLRGTPSALPITPNPVYTANYGAVAPVTYNQPVTQPAYGFGSGLSRFFNSPLGSNTSYSTSYNQAPITYYRPMSSVDPTTGTTVTVQRPCTSYVEQLQRVPQNSFRPLTSTPGSTCPPPTSCPAPATCSPGTGYPLSVGPSPIVSPSPSVTPAPTMTPASPMTPAPLSPAPSAPATISPVPSSPPTMAPPASAPLSGSPSPSAADPQDAQDVPQPRLEAARPETPGETPSKGASDGNQAPPTPSESPSETPSGDAAIKLDPPVASRGAAGATVSPSGQQFTVQTPPSMQTPAAGTIGQSYSTLKPIGVPAAEVTQPTAASTPSETLTPLPTPATEPPPLPLPSVTAPRSSSGLFRNSEASASARIPSRDQVSVPVREATTRQETIRPVADWQERLMPVRPAAPVVIRDNSGWIPSP